MKRKPYQKHYLEFRKSDKTKIKITLKDWARDNLNEFGSNYSYINMPSTHKIRDLLISRFNYKLTIGQDGCILLVESN